MVKGATGWEEAWLHQPITDAHCAGPDDLAVIPYTSGTTGEPRGCMHTHRSVMHTTIASAEFCRIAKDQIGFAALPMFHVTGLQLGVNAVIAWSREQMSACKVPHVVEFVESLPRSGTGKVAWRELQERELAKRLLQAPPSSPLRTRETTKRITSSMKIRESDSFKIGGPRATYVLIICSLLYAAQYADFQVMAVVLQPMKIALNLSDGQVGLIVAAYSIGIIVAILPASHMIDTWSRKKTIGLMAFVWSIFTLTTGLAGGLFVLVLSRFGVSLGEAGFAPGGTALVSASYPGEKRGQKLGIFNTFVTIGVIFGVIFGVVLGGLPVSAPWWLAYTVLYLCHPRYRARHTGVLHAGLPPAERRRYRLQT